MSMVPKTYEEMLKNPHNQMNASWNCIKIPFVTYRIDKSLRFAFRHVHMLLVGV